VGIVGRLSYCRFTAFPVRFVHFYTFVVLFLYICILEQINDEEEDDENIGVISNAACVQ